ncbi:MAG TPA: sulfotransferase [Gaiellales bacterium]|nr:sulfotransferase [Gaiellales bacterium]
MSRERGARNDNYSRLPRPLAAAAKTVLFAPRIATAGRRVLPSFLVVGAQRSGTTSLYRYLLEHPGIGGAWPSKGVHHFDLESQRSRRWYRAHFPRRSEGVVAGEGSPYYLFHPLVPARVAAALPDVRVIAMLRDPVTRAHSQYQQEYARGFEDAETFERALELEPGRLRGEEERLVVEPGYRSYSHQHHSYVARGMYLDQLLRWESAIPPERMLVLVAEEFFADPAAVHRRVLRFLDVPEPPSPPRFAAYNARPYDPLAAPTRASLTELFAEPNRLLERHLGRELGWSANARARA